MLRGHDASRRSDPGSCRVRLHRLAGHPGITTLTILPGAINVTVATDGTVVGLVGDVMTVNHADTSTMCTKVSMVHVQVRGTPGDIYNHAPGASGNSLCTFNNNALSFSATFWTQSDVRAACFGQPGASMSLYRTLDAYLDYDTFSSASRTTSPRPPARRRH